MNPLSIHLGYCVKHMVCWESHLGRQGQEDKALLLSATQVPPCQQTRECSTGTLPFDPGLYREKVSNNLLIYCTDLGE